MSPGACRSSAAPSPGLPSRKWLWPVPSRARFLEGRAEVAGDGQRLGVVIAGPVPGSGLGQQLPNVVTHGAAEGIPPPAKDPAGLVSQMAS